MTEKEIRVQLALGTFDIKYLTVEAIENIDDVNLVFQLYSEVPKCWVTKSHVGILIDAIYDQYDYLSKNRK